jgi:hypothetical protein
MVGVDLQAARPQPGRLDLLAQQAELVVHAALAREDLLPRVPHTPDGEDRSGRL